MININIFIKALHASWLRHIIVQSDNAFWCSVSNIHLGKLLSFGSGYKRIKSFLERHFKQLAFIL